MISPSELLDQLGIPYEDKVTRLQIHCPFHHDVNPSSGFYRDTEKFWCFSCEILLDVVGFYAKVREVSRPEAERALGVWRDVPAEQIQTARPHLSFEALIRTRGESALKSTVRIGADKAAFGERLDKILWAWQNGKITHDQADKALHRWRRELLTPPGDML